MAGSFFSILQNRPFFAYSFAGAFSFAPTFLYVAGSPIIFMEIFHVSPETYGGIFALISVGFIGSNQINIFPDNAVPIVAMMACASLVAVLLFAGGTRSKQ